MSSIIYKRKARSFKDFPAFSFHRGNRCFTTDLDEAAKYGFSASDAGSFSRRVNKFKNALLQSGWQSTEQIVFGRIGDSKQMFVIDGQGRISALREMTKNDISAPFPNNIEVPYCIVQYEDEDEMLNSLRGINMVAKPWSGDDLYHSYVEMTTDPDIKAGYKKYCEVVDDYKVNTSMARFILWGTKKKDTKMDNFKFSTILPNAEIVLAIISATVGRAKELNIPEKKMTVFRGYKVLASYQLLSSFFMKRQTVKDFMLKYREFLQKLTSQDMLDIFDEKLIERMYDRAGTHRKIKAMLKDVIEYKKLCILR